MHRVNRGITPAPTPISSPSREVGCSQTNRCAPTFKQEQREKLLEDLRAGIETAVIPVADGATLSQALAEFQESSEFSKLVKKTIGALEGILLFTKQELGNEKSIALEKSLGLMLNKMMIPRTENPWFQCQDQFDQDHVRTYSTEEMLHAYQSSCREIQVLEKLMQSALRGDSGLTPQQAKDVIKPIISELPLLITVCGAGSLINIQDLLKSLQDQLLPCDLSGKFDNQVELIVQEHIRALLRELFKNESDHQGMEIHRVKAVRFLATSLCDLPRISIDTDHYAKSFLDQLNAKTNPLFLSYFSKISRSLSTQLKERIRPDVVCIDLARCYFERVKSFLISKGVDVENIPYNSKCVEEAIESLASEYNKPPEKYLFEEVWRDDYSRSLSHSPILLASWFFMQLVESTPSVRVASLAQRVLLTKPTFKKGGTTLESAGLWGSKMQVSQGDSVYQIKSLCWRNAVDPHLGFAEQVKIENLSPEWVSAHFKNDPVDRESFDVFIYSLVNTVNQIKSSDSLGEETHDELKKFLSSQEIRDVGLGVLSDVPLSFLDSYEKVKALLIVHLASDVSPDKSSLGRLFLNIDSINDRNKFNREKMISELVHDAVSEINNNPEIAVNDNKIVRNFVSVILGSKYRRSEEMLSSENLVIWAVKNGNSNLTRLIVQGFKSSVPPAGFKDFINGFFKCSMYKKVEDNNVFYKWPDLPGAFGVSALGFAALVGDLELASIFMEEGISPNEGDQYGYTPLAYAAAYGSKKMLEHLISHGARLDGVPLSGKSTRMPPILAASMAERVDLVDALLKAGANVNQASSTNQMTALFAAYHSGNLELIKRLYAYGAEHNAKATLFNASPLSKKRTSLEVLLSRLKSSTSSEFKISRSKRILQLATVYVFHHVYHQIPFDDNVLMHGYPLLHVLTYQQNMDGVKMLIDSLSDQPELKAKLLNARSSGGTHKKTPLMVAAKQGATDVAAYLLSHPETDILLTDSKGRTALQIAEQYGNHALCELLSQHMSSSVGGGVDFLRSPLSRNMGGRSPFHRFFLR